MSASLANRAGELLRQQFSGHDLPALDELQCVLRELETRQQELEQENDGLRATVRRLEAYRDRYIDLYDFAPSGYVTLDQDGYVQEINLAGASMLSAERDALIGYRFEDYVVAEDRDAFLDHVRQCAHQRRDVTTELRLASKTGRTITAQLHSIPIEGSSNETLCKTAITDLTERRRAEEELEQERNLLRTLVDNLPDCVYIKDEQSRFVVANQATAQIMGVATPDELLGKTDFDFYASQVAAEYRADEEEILRSGKPLLSKHEPHVYHGQKRTILTTKVPLKDRQGKAIGLVGISRDITEREQDEQSSRRAQYEAKKASQEQRWFLTHVGHDLRTPLSAILGAVELSLERATDPTVSDLLKMAKESADLLLARLNDVLDCARIQLGKMGLLPAPISLHRMLDQLCQALRSRATQKGLSFSCTIAPEVPDAVLCDQTRLRQILLNLAENGMIFTERGEVALGVRVESQRAEEVCLEFAVRDTGIGIPHRDLKRIFKPFAEADAASPRRLGGTGLGLTICQSLVTLMGGRIWVESEPGKGSTFYFTARLPKTKEPPAEPQSGPEVAAPTGSLRVLLVEDSLANQRLAAFILTGRGHAVEVAGSGRQAIRMAQENLYDVILMDISLPGMDGLQTTAAIRARENAGRRVAIIAMTGYASPGDREQCLHAGMDGYLAKPFDAREMIALVETLAARKTA